MSKPLYDRAVIMELKASGKKNTEIAEIMGCSLAVVSHTVRRRSSEQVLADAAEDRKKVLAAYAAGHHTPHAIWKETGLDARTCRYYLEEHYLGTKKRRRPSQEEDVAKTGKMEERQSVGAEGEGAQRGRGRRAHGPRN